MGPCIVNGCRDNILGGRLVYDNRDLRIVYANWKARV